MVTAADMITNRSFLSIGFIASICYAYCLCMVPSFVRVAKINILRHSRRFFKCAYKALLPAAP
ncbi:hypothetical protein EZU64_17315 [Escherichia coli]|nr:hypothetical protein [Escherichia coli]EFA6643704.1 hypothetical protein [Escherichia coli]